MVTSSIVSVACLENSLDCSPDYYRPENLKRSNLLRKQLCSKLRSVSYVTDGEHGSPDWDVHSGIRYIAAEHILANTISDAPMRTISVAQDTRNARCRIQKNDVLVYSVGAYAGLAARAEPHFFPASIPRSVAIIRLNADAPFRPGFVAVFLNSEFGQFQTRRLRAGNSQPVLALEKIKQIELPHIPIGLQDEIDVLYEQAYQSRLSGQHSYVCAKKILESELGLDKLTFQKPIGYIANFSEALTSRRIDADYFQPQYAKVRSLLTAYSGGYEPLLACCEAIRPNMDASKIPTQTFDYIELSNINASIGIVDGALTCQGSELPSRARRQVRTGDIIASAVVGSINKAAIIADQQNGFLASTGFFHLRSRTVLPEYLLMLVRSQCVRMQFHQQATGGILSAVPDNRLRHVIIPKLPEAIQQKITALVIGAHTAKRESERLLEQAKNRVEQLIESAIQS